MDASVPTPSRSSLLSTYWRDPEWLAHVPLNSSTALDYFSRSNFFDPESTNEVYRMQNIANPQSQIPGMGKTAQQQEEELKRFKGIEFVVVHAKEPPTAQGVPGSSRAMQPSSTSAGDESLFIVQKRRRDSPVKTQVLETYYILNGNIHMAPDLETVLNNRMVTALHSLRESLSLARAAQARPITMTTSKASQQARGKGKTLGADVAQESAQAAEAAAAARDVRETEEDEDARRRKSPMPSNQAYPIPSIFEPAKTHQATSPLTSVGAFLMSLQHFAFGTPLGTAVTGAAATAGSLLIYWRYLRRIRSAEYITPRELKWRRSLTGRVTHIGDADGFRLYHQPGPAVLRSIFYPVPKTTKSLRDETLSIRLAGADAPEMGHFGKEAQPFATEAKEELSRLINGRTVRCEIAHVDQYKRLVATPYVWLPPYVFGSTNVSLHLVQKGLATVYRQGGAEYGSASFLWRLLFKSKSGLARLERAETTAKRRKLGMWSQKKGFESPAEYKRRLREQQ